MSSKAPPIGIMPRRFYDERTPQLPGVADTQRVSDLLGAIQRYSVAGLPCPPQWAEEAIDRLGLKAELPTPTHDPEDPFAAYYLGGKQPPDPFAGNGPKGRFTGNEPGGVDELDR